MAYIYAFRIGNEDRFKIGKTVNSLEQQRKRLQKDSPDALTLFGSFAIARDDDALAGEHFIKQRYFERMTHSHETFRFTAAEVHDVLAAAREFIEHRLPQQRANEKRVAELAVLTPVPEMLTATEDLKRLCEELRERTRQRAVAQNAVKALESDIAQLEAQVKVAIGATSGIEGYVSWTMGRSRGKFNPERVREADPDLYEQYVKPQFDAAGFRAEQNKLYTECMDTSPAREFRLIDEP